MTTIGTISHGTLRSEDLLEAFADELDRCEPGHKLVAEAFTMLEAWNDDNEPGDVSEVLDDLANALDEYSPPYCYFGTCEGDGSDFGFWPMMEAIEELEKFDEVPNDLPGDDFVVVNDHGNVTLYGADGKEIWAVV